ncbi:outer membrane protein [Shewanella sp. NFH-SH190041]|uniref:porin family protein n=1 Tax=Shewanella sp. NFH-SH190041 TaxID=2950245 RepID=UPI0021C4A3E4|nr:porin family protein [Shewanella sp. NFH-SH190041]BDM65535.1 outer membrane protein [Shewanella sp. NFH-SH190041]
MPGYKRRAVSQHVKTGIRVAVISGLLSGPLAAAEAGRIFFTPMGGYSFGASSLDLTDAAAEQSDSASIQESANYALMLGMTTNDPGDVYLLYSHQDTELRSGGLFAAQRLSDLQLDYLHLGGTLYFPSGMWEPYVTASAGLTQLRPAGELNSETRFSMGLGLGTLVRFSDHLALLAEVRGFATFVDADNELFCDGSRCQWLISASTLLQGQANLGIQFRF